MFPEVRESKNLGNASDVVVRSGTSSDRRLVRFKLQVLSDYTFIASGVLCLIFPIKNGFKRSTLKVKLINSFRHVAVSSFLYAPPCWEYPQNKLIGG